MRTRPSIRPDLGLWVVADGMGGHDSGGLCEPADRRPAGQVPPPNSASTLLAETRNRLERANSMLRAKAAERGHGSIIASTVVVLMAFGEHFACLWAGDSRMYRLRDGEFLQVTHDHSHVQELVDVGVLSADEAESHPQANVVTRAVGADDALALDKKLDRLQADDVFLLCSDGLTRVVPDQDIAGILRSRGPRYRRADAGRHRAGTRLPRQHHRRQRALPGAGRDDRMGDDGPLYGLSASRNLLSATRSATLAAIADIRCAVRRAEIAGTCRFPGIRC